MRNRWEGKQPSFVLFHDQQPLRPADELPAVVTVLWVRLDQSPLEVFLPARAYRS